MYGYLEILVALTRSISSYSFLVSLNFTHWIASAGTALWECLLIKNERRFQSRGAKESEQLTSLLEVPLGASLFREENEWRICW